MATYDIEPEQKLKLPPRVEEFSAYLQTIKGKSPSTVEAYSYDLTVFLRFLMQYKGKVAKDSEFEAIDLSGIGDEFYREISLPNLYAFLSFAEKQRDNSAHARARKVASIKAFFRYLHGKARILDSDPSSELESPRIRKRNPVYLSLDEAVLILQSMDRSHRDHHRDYCMLTLFLNCGLRISELTSIRWSMIRDDTLRIIGKGNKERTVYLNRACLAALKDLKEHQELEGVAPEYQDYLFLSSHKRPISNRTVERLVKKHITNAGIDSTAYTPHKLRHTAATLMYKHGNVDILALQSILGHENLSTTQIYTHVDNEQLRESAEANPLRDIDQWTDLTKDREKPGK